MKSLSMHPSTSDVAHETNIGGRKVAFVKPDFDMEQQGFTSRAPQPWMAVPADSSEWLRLRKTGEWSDFTVVAGGSDFRVHCVKLCKESYYFKAVCSGGFAETAKQSIELPESAQVISILLDEMYGVYNTTTGSIFTNFALRMEIEKELMMNQLLDLFIAADKVTALVPLFPYLHTNPQPSTTSRTSSAARPKPSSTAFPS